MKLSDIKLNEDNPRYIRDDKFEQLKQSITAFPQMLRLRPIVIDENNIVLGGNMRLRALQELGYTELEDEWVKRADELTEEQKREFIIKDNVGYGSWEWETLANEWDSEELAEWGLDVPEHWVSEEEVEAEEDDYEEPDNLQVDVVLGDLIEIGEHRLLCGDSSSVDDLDKLMVGDKADICFTDPPYGVAYVGKTSDAMTIRNDDLNPDELKEKVSEWFSIVDAALKEGAYVLATVPPGPLHLIFAQDWIERGWLRQIMVWNKDSMVFGHSEYHYKHEPILFGWKPGGTRLKNKDRTKTTVWEFDRPKASREHPTMKPVEMWAYGIINHSKPNDLCFEPFGGSGTSFIAAHQLNRKCYGMELDPKYCQVIIDRMHKLDPSLPIKINGKDYQPKTA